MKKDKGEDYSRQCQLFNPDLPCSSYRQDTSSQAHYPGEWVARDRTGNIVLGHGKDPAKLCDEMQGRYGRTGTWYVAKDPEEPSFISRFLRKILPGN